VARVGLSRVTAGSRQRGIDGCDPGRTLDAPLDQQATPMPLSVWHLPQTLRDMLGVPASLGPLEKYTPEIAPSVAPLQEMLAMLTPRPRWNLGSHVDDILVGSQYRSGGWPSIWRVRGGARRNANEAWSLSTKGRDPRTKYSRWKVAVAPNGMVIATKIADVGGAQARLAAWTSDRTEIADVDTATKEMFKQLLAELPDLARGNVPGWLVPGNGHSGPATAPQRGARVLR